MKKQQSSTGQKGANGQTKVKKLPTRNYQLIN